MEAVGFASAILTFVEFSAKIIAGSYEVYSSATGTTDENADLRRVTEDLQLLTQRLTVPGNVDPTGENAILAELGKNCREISSDLIAMLKTLQTQKSNSKTESLRVALRSLRKRKDVESLEKRLGLYRRQIIDRMIVMMRSVYHQSFVPSAAT